ncbi:MerR family transcriptional regulator [Actinoplanes philippinensis]|uniref:DNA-binding transcriptional regulator, MerR family n=1 Tax=Actinoplanes philippinensis TaxID=35752 RepID=A0A1I2CUE4_9ACTN|nr:MerR family transcriptional regulator [Actinoplanes philippinensis]GIE74679.1 MerR family transcriptional regulator [Actinoplanes philippinensis]SFE71802.1 DNA-binding transcriptional regulator, MerR family [Actinoplanes philippinensis]
MRIGELARAAGVSTRALRYYEEQGLLVSQRRGNGYREYGEHAVRQVAFIQDLYSAGLPSEVIREILPCTGPAGVTGDCSALQAKVQEVRDRLARQERQIAGRREMLERYLSGADAPAEFTGLPGLSAGG